MTEHEQEQQQEQQQGPKYALSESVATSCERLDTPVIKDAAQGISRLTLGLRLSEVSTWQEAQHDSDLMRAFERHLASSQREHLDLLWGLESLRTLEYEGLVCKATILHSQHAALFPIELQDTSAFERELHNRASSSAAWEILQPTYDQLTAIINALLDEFLSIEDTQRTQNNSVPMLNLVGLSRAGSLNDILSLMNHELSSRYKTNRTTVAPQQDIYLPQRLLANHPNCIPLLLWRNHPLGEAPSATCPSPSSSEGGSITKPGRRRSRSALQNLLKWGEKADKE